MNPKISIITVTYNCEAYLENTIQSIIDQSAKIYEIIIIDGGSTDGTISIIRKYESYISYWISESDKGIYDAMNKGINLAKGEYLLFLNAGDTLHKNNTLEEIPFDQNPNAEIFYGETVILNKNGDPLGLRRKKLPTHLSWKHFRRGMVVCHQSILVRKNIAPCYDLKYKYSADIDWVINSLKKSKQIIFTNTIISNFIEGGFSNQNLKMSWLDRIRILNKSFGIFQITISHLIFVIENVLLKLKLIPRFRKYN